MFPSQEHEMHPQDLMKPDLLREVVLLVSGGVILLVSVLPEAAALARASVTDILWKTL
jgi:hypothetical protein